MFGSDSSADKRARVAKQLRDKNGRWIEMGGLVKYTDDITKEKRTGIVKDILDDGRAVINRTDRPGGYQDRVQGRFLEAIDEKATLDVPTVPTKTVKENHREHIDGFNVSVDGKGVSVEKPDGYGSGDSIYFSKENLSKISEQLQSGKDGTVSFGDTTAEIKGDSITFESQYVNPNDGMPGPMNSFTMSKSSFDKVVAASGTELKDKEVPDYSKMLKKTPEVKKAPEPYKPAKPFVPAPRHTLHNGNNKIEVTEKEVNIFSEDGYGTGDSKHFSKENFKKLAAAYDEKKDSLQKIQIGDQTVTFLKGKMTIWSQYVNPNDGMPQPAKSITINNKAIEDIMKIIDKPLTASIHWSPLTEFAAAELPVGSELKNSTGIKLLKVADNLWEYPAKSGKVSYNNNSIDSLKAIDSVFFEVELNS